MIEVAPSPAHPGVQIANTRTELAVARRERDLLFDLLVVILILWTVINGASLVLSEWRRRKINAGRLKL